MVYVYESMGWQYADSSESADSIGSANGCGSMSGTIGDLVTISLADDGHVDYYVNGLYDRSCGVKISNGSYFGFAMQNGTFLCLLRLISNYSCTQRVN